MRKLAVMEFVTLDGVLRRLGNVVLGTRKRLFREYDRPVRLRLVSCRPTPTGVLMLSDETA